VQTANSGAARAPADGWGQRVLVLSEGENPSLAFFIAPLLRARGLAVVLADCRAAPPRDAAFDAVVVIRYLPAAWDGLLARARRDGKPVAYFMDDDLLDRAAHAGLPLRYRFKIERLACLRRRAIEHLCSEFWVSTPYLAGKYAALQPMLVEAAAPPSSPLVSVSYHGTASHAGEQAWLHALVTQLQSRCDRTHFSIVGDGRINRQFRALPRVTVLHPMSWPAYLAYTATYRCDIALAPLLPGNFNAARGATKFLDFARMGAAGIYADVAPYRGHVRHGIDGLLLPMQPDAWLAAIIDLVQDEARRRQLAAAARARIAPGTQP